MAKIKCAECKKEIDDTNKQCPNCGYKNKLDINLYLKEQGNNNICTKCGKKLNKNDSFCTKCGTKKDKLKISSITNLIKTIFKRNKLIIIISIIIVSLLSALIIENNNFNRDIEKAKQYYNDKEFYEVSQIVDKYSILHKNNEFIRKYNYIEYLLTDYTIANPQSKYRDDKDKLKYLIRGYSNCIEKKTTNDWEQELVDEVKSFYYSAINNIVSLSRSEIEEISKLEKTELETKVNSLLKEEEKKNTCKVFNVKVLNYSKYGTKMSVTLKNNNGCTWNIKSYSEVRVNFTDGSYEEVYLGTNIDLKADEKYTFNDCYLGSDNKNKTIKSVAFID